MIRAILRAQLLSMRGFGFRRHPGAWLAFIPGLLFYLTWAAIATSAYFVFGSLDSPPALLTWLTGGLFVVFLYWQIAPVITASMGASLDLGKLIVYPIPLDRLFLVEVMLRFLTVSEMLIVLAGVTLGLARNPAVGGWLTLACAALGFTFFVAFNLLVSAGLRSLIERLFERPRMKEITALVFVLLCALPGGAVALHFRWESLLALLPLGLPYPWGAAAAIATGGPTGPFLLALAILLAWVAAAYFFGRNQFYRSLRFDPFQNHTPSARKAGPSWIDAAFRLPGRIWGDPLAAMIEKELRSLSRCAGFRLVFFMGFTFSLLLFLPPLLNRSHSDTFLSHHILAWISLYSLMLCGFYTFWNSFGYDRAAAQFYFAAPVPFRRVILAKNIAAALAQLLEGLIITAIYAVLPIPFQWAQIPEAAVVTAVSCLYLFAFGNVTSVRFPSPVDPAKMSRGAAARSKNALAVFILPLAFLPITLAYLANAVFHNAAIFYLLLLLAGAIGGVFYWIATDSAVAWSVSRREPMIARLSRGSGPLTAD